MTSSDDASGKDDTPSFPTWPNSGSQQWPDYGARMDALMGANLGANLGNNLGATLGAGANPVQGLYIAGGLARAPHGSPVDHGVIFDLTQIEEIFRYACILAQQGDRDGRAITRAWWPYVTHRYREIKQGMVRSWTPWTAGGDPPPENAVVMLPTSYWNTAYIFTWIVKHRVIIDRIWLRRLRDQGQASTIVAQRVSPFDLSNDPRYWKIDIS